MKTLPWLTMVAVGILSVGCERSDPAKPGADPAAASKTPATAAAAPATASEAPREMTTKSGITMVWLPGGEFTMGSDQGEADEKPAHRVRLTPFMMDRFEVTQEMFARVQLPNPSHWQENPKLPVERVRWRDAKRYCNERSLLEGLKPCYNEKTVDWDVDATANGYRLPTEAEWEYACRAGGEAPAGTAADKLRPLGWFADNADEKTHLVGQKKANAFGLHDLLGNVSEWCEDVYSPDFYAHSPATDPQGPPSPGKDVKRVIRGGSWKSSAAQCRASARQGERTGDTDACFSTDYCGFRCVRRPTPEEMSGMTFMGGSR